MGRSDVSDARALPKIALGSVYDPPQAPYPTVLVMRRWPRGVRRDAVGEWQRDLGPSAELLDSYRAEAVGWADFADRYRAEMREQSALIARVAQMAATTGVTLLCGSHPEERCHRSLLRDPIEQRLAACAEGPDGVVGEGGAGAPTCADVRPA